MASRATSWNDLNEFGRAALVQVVWLHLQTMPLAIVPELDSRPFLLQHAVLTVTNMIKATKPILDRIGSDRIGSKCNYLRVNTGLA